MQIFTKKKLIKELNDILELLNKMPDDMYFHANVEFSGISKKFMQLSQQFNIKKAQEKKKEQKNKENSTPEANI